jgi:hypothetical protein
MCGGIGAAYGMSPVQMLDSVIAASRLGACPPPQPQEAVMTTTVDTSAAAEPASVDAIESDSWSVSQLRSDRRRLERLLDYELSAS